MARLPQPGADDGIWGSVLNDYLSISHDSGGAFKQGIVSELNLDISVRGKLNAPASIADGSIAETKLSTAVQNKLNAAPVANGVNTVNSRSGDVTLTKSDVGLGNVDNTADAAKPVSTAVQSALDAKAATTHVHTASQISDATTTGRSVLTAADAAAARTAIGAGTSNLALGTTSTTAKAGDYVPTKADVGLANVDNTSDLNKPVSTAMQAALNLKANTADLGSKVLLVDNAAALPAGTPVGVIVIVKS